MGGLSATSREQRRSPGAWGKSWQTLHSLGLFSKGEMQVGCFMAVFRDVLE